MKRKYISFLITTILLLSCERMLEVNFSDEKPLIVMNGVVEPDKPISVAVSKSFLFTDTDSTAPYLKDVSVELHVNDTFVEKLQRFTIDTAKYRARRGNSYFRSESHVKVGDRVKIKASAPGLETAWVETVIPTPAAIEKVDTATFFVPATGNNTFGFYWNPYGEYSWNSDSGWGYGGYYIPVPEIFYEPFYRRMRLHIGVRKQKNDVAHYFLLRIIAENTEYKDYPFNLPVETQDDPIFARDPKNLFLEKLFNNNYSTNSSSVFTDNLFKDNAYTLNVSTGELYTVKVEHTKPEKEGEKPEYLSHEVKNPPIEVWIYTLSHDYYSYLKSVEKWNYDEEFDVISEPRVTYSNVHNGIGFVGSMSYTSKRIQIPPYPGGKNTVPR